MNSQAATPAAQNWSPPEVVYIRSQQGGRLNQEMLGSRDEPIWTQRPPPNIGLHPLGVAVSMQSRRFALWLRPHFGVRPKERACTLRLRLGIRLILNTT